MARKKQDRHVPGSFKLSLLCRQEMILGADKAAGSGFQELLEFFSGEKR